MFCVHLLVVSDSNFSDRLRPLSKYSRFWIRQHAYNPLYLSAGKRSGTTKERRIYCKGNANSKKDRKEPRRSPKFHFYILALQWPMTTCQKEHTCKQLQTSAVPKTQWTIHGLWPQVAATQKLKQNSSKIKPLPGHKVVANGAHMFLEWSKRLSPNERRELLSYWPDVSQPDSTMPTDFHLHEWCKHGVESGMSIGEYFQKAVELVKRYDVFAMLAAKNILPTAERLLQERTVQDAISAQVHRHVALKCFVSGGPSKLWEVRICFDAFTLSPFDCHLKSGSKNKCSMPSIYPPW